MAAARRRITYRLYPSPTQAAQMERVCDLHRTLYNAALEERVDACRKAGKSISFADQCRSVTAIRLDDPAYRGLNAQSLQVTLKRLEHAFQNFFRRVKARQTPGFPRFKGRDRFAGFGFKSHGDGFRFTPGQGWRYGKLVESFNGRLRDECLNANWFLSSADARSKIETWRRHYNESRPHTALGWRTPQEFALAAALQAAE